MEQKKPEKLKEIISNQAMNTQEVKPSEASCNWLNNAKCIFNNKTKVFTNNYLYDKYNIDVITDLLKYFGGKSCKIDNNKGLFIYGPIGSGKTLIMKIFHEIMKNSNNSFKFISATEIVNIYARTGNINMFFRNEDGFPNRPIRICIDELGAESNTAKYYGNEINILQEVLQNRYYLHQEGIKTYITSNLKPSEIGEKYGERIQDRMREMFNVIILDTDKSRRK